MESAAPGDYARGRRSERRRSEMTGKDEQDGREKKALIKEAYGEIAGGERSPCCGGSDDEQAALGFGYSAEDLAVLPEDALLGLSCGNPLAEAALKEGEVVLDLGSGGGNDLILAYRQVGPGGKAIGVDMTPAMVDRARKAAKDLGFDGVEFRLGEIEDLPVEDSSVDVVISNCVINLSPDKPKVFREVCRVLKPGGRMVVADIVLTRELPEAIRASAVALVACLAGAVTLDKYLQAIRSAGLEMVEVQDKGGYDVLGPDSPDPLVRKVYETIPEARNLRGAAASVIVTARKPKE